MPKFDFFIVLMGLNDFLYDYRIHHSLKTPKNWWRKQALMYLSGNEGQFAVQAISKRIIDGARNSNKMAPQSDFGAYMEYLWQAYDNVNDDQWVTILPDSPPTSRLTEILSVISKPTLMSMVPRSSL